MVAFPIKWVRLVFFSILNQLMAESNKLDLQVGNNINQRAYLKIIHSVEVQVMDLFSASHHSPMHHNTQLSVPTISKCAFNECAVDYR